MTVCSRPYYITTAISYPNGLPHIGHAYEAIATDALARFMRLKGRDVYFVTGTDEHGLKMFQTAREEGIAPQILATRNTAKFQEMVALLGCTHQAFIRTSSPLHHKAAQALWTRMMQAGDIYKGTYAGWYSLRDEAYYAEEETGLNAEGIRVGPQGTSVTWVEEESYFFRLSRYAPALLAHYAAHPDFIGPIGRRQEVVRFVEGGLRDLSISRKNFDWGIPVPGDPEHIMYVWVDALANYLTAVGFPEETGSLWRYWPAQLHVIGKDILRFHAVYWPAFLMSAGLPLPERIFAHGFLFNRGEKMSKSTGNVIDPFALVARWGVDPLRYFLLREVPFGQDGNYTQQGIVQRNNADLANDLGNLVQRSLSMIAKHCEGRIPAPMGYSSEDQNLLAAADALYDSCAALMETQEMHKVLAEIWEVIGDTNRYFAAQEPWALRKEDPPRMGTVLYVTAEVLRQVGILIQPFIPHSAERLLEFLAIPSEARGTAFLGEKGRLVPGRDLPSPSGLFPKYVFATEFDSEETAEGNCGESGACAYVG